MRTPAARSRRTVDVVVGVLIWLFGLPSLLLAHGGGMTGEDLRPIAVSAALAVVGYWTVILWPKRKKADPDYRGPLKKKRIGHFRQAPRAGGDSYGPDTVSNQ
jgi:hypothetical protein